MKTKSKELGGLLSPKERRDLDRLSRKAGLELQIAKENYESDEAHAAFHDNCFATHKDYMNAFPSRFGLKLPKDGGWVLIKDPPPCQITVPPFSIWFATPWLMKGYSGTATHRVKITTPGGDLGVMPCEYSPVAKISEYIGREKEGILIHHMNSEPVVNVDSLFYLMSRGIPRAAATMLLIEQIKDPTFLWFEIAPPYGRHFGKEWPSPERCPFATKLEDWHETKISV